MKQDRFRHLRLQFHRDRGFSLLEVLVSMAVLGMIGVFYLRSQTATQTALKSIQSSKSVADVNDLVVSQINTFVKSLNPAVAGCANLATSFNNKALSLSTTSTLNYTKDLLSSSWYSKKLSDGQREKLKGYFSGPYNDLSKRCTKPRTPANVNNAADNSFYFCLAISQDPAANSQSFLSAPVAFAEIAIQLEDLKTGQTLSCTTFAPGGATVGARIYYSIYWATQLAGDFTIKKNANTSIFGN